MARVLTRWMVDELKEKLEAIQGGVVVDYTGLDSQLTFNLRSSLRQANMKVTVVKNTMAARALADLGFPEAAGVLKGPSAIIHGGDGPPAVARAVIDWKKKNKAKALQIKGAFIPGRKIDESQIEALSKMPDRPQALAMVLGVVQAAARQFVSLNQLAAIQPLHLLRAYAEKREGKG